MSTKKNSLWSFFSSVKLALFVLFLLAVASIIGTVIPQNSPPEEYVKLYGEQTAKLFQLLDIPDMYSSWWFTTLLVLLALNLTVCTIERLPHVWRMVVMNNLDVELDRLPKMNPRKEMASDAPARQTADQAMAALRENGWKASRAERDGGILLFAQKGPWTRLGVYVVHASILIIFAGAMIGSFFGYKGSVMIPETRQTDTIYQFGTQQPINLGFAVRCDRFTLTHYPNGAPKEFRSELTILDNGQETLKKSIVVNDPLSYKGHTLYQSSYQSYQQFLVTMVNKKTNKGERFLVDPGREIRWDAEQVSFGVINRDRTQTPMKFQYKIWFADKSGKGEPFWITEGDSTTITRGDQEYLFDFKEFFATGLQVTKDPGVWYVYIGCILMLLGLFVAFFLSHRRVWVYITEKDAGSAVLICGNVNKNKPAFEKKFEAIDMAITGKIESLR